MEYLSKGFREMVGCKEGHNLFATLDKLDGKTKLNPKNANIFRKELRFTIA